MCEHTVEYRPGSKCPPPIVHAYIHEMLCLQILDGYCECDWYIIIICFYILQNIIFPMCIHTFIRRELYLDILTKTGMV